MNAPENPPAAICGRKSDDRARTGRQIRRIAARVAAESQTNRSDSGGGRDE